jgi:hypothetical protein
MSQSDIVLLLHRMVDRTHAPPPLTVAILSFISKAAIPFVPRFPGMNVIWPVRFDRAIFGGHSVCNALQGHSDDRERQT